MDLCFDGMGKNIGSQLQNIVMQNVAPENPISQKKCNLDGSHED